MSETNPAPADLPSPRQLVRSTVIALVVAGLLLVTVVMPAEYGVDPTGVGRVLGLKEMGEIKMQLAREAAVADSVERATGIPAAGASAPVSSSAAPVPDTSAAPAKSDEITVTLAPNEGKEVKLAMRKDARVDFLWKTDRGVVNYDTHADRTAPPAIKYHGYEKGQATPADSGVLVAAFDGMHGWFWRNRTREVVTVTLRTRGDYTELKRME